MCHLQVPTSKFLCTLSVLCSHHQVSLLLKGAPEALFYLLYSVFQQIASRMSFTFLKDPHPINWVSRFWNNEGLFLKFILQLGRQKQLFKLQLKMLSTFKGFGLNQEMETPSLKMSHFSWKDKGKLSKRRGLLVRGKATELQLEKPRGEGRNGVAKLGIGGWPRLYH